jgi:CMP-N,N'-diacetyllegionaminic acid synthase
MTVTEDGRPRVVAIIPAKGRSVRVPGKNLRLLAGRPLFAHTIEQARRSRLLHEVYVSTDSEEIKALAEASGAAVPFMRPPELAADDVHGSAPILDMLEKLGGAARYAYCVQLLPTSPLRSAATIDAVVQLSIARAANVLSVTPGKTVFHLRTVAEDGTLQAVLDQYRGVYNFQSEGTRVVSLNGAVYCAPVAQLLEHRSFQYGSPLAYVMDPVEAIDIDSERDFQIAERLAELV